MNRDPANDFSYFLAWLQQHSPDERQTADLLASIDTQWQQCNHGDLPSWQSALDALATLPTPDTLEYDQRIIGANNSAGTLSADAVLEIATQLQAFKPWRKGPWQYMSVDIDTEWRSDLKWDRLKHAIDLQDKTVLDVGCGSGYHAWRMLGAGAESVIGIDPTWLFVYQFALSKRWFVDLPVFVLPLTMQQMRLQSVFDVTFSMGVLYHRRDPIEHLQELKNSLKRGGELVLETLVVEGDQQTLLMPKDRYAAMPNVWFIPSVELLVLWLERLRMIDIEIIDVSPTSLEEQRVTDWIGSHSLADFLDADDINKTREGYPAPRRAIIKARKR